MTAPDDPGQPGPWIEASQPGNCRMCGARWEPGSQVRYDPAVPGLVCHACGQPEEPDGLLGQILGDQEGGEA